MKVSESFLLYHIYDELYIYNLCERGLSCQLVLIMSFFYQNASSNVSRLLIGNKIDADPDEIVVTTLRGNNVSHAFFINIFFLLNM